MSRNDSTPAVPNVVLAYSMPPPARELAQLLDLAEQYHLDPHDLDQEVAARCDDERLRETLNLGGWRSQLEYLLAVESGWAVQEMLERYRRDT